MKKTLVSALTTALVVGAASTTFAAANPFSDVPADHWAYDAVAQLAKDGVVEGYGDGTYVGEECITRYEMAQVVARAMAKTDLNKADKSMVDKLAAEFADELNNLGVRVAALEKKVDNVTWGGYFRYTWVNDRVAGEEKSTGNELRIRLSMAAKINENWTGKARMEYITDMKDAKNTTDVTVNRIYAEGNYDNLNIQLGKFPYFTMVDKGMIIDEDLSGAQVTFGKDVKVKVMAGRLCWDDSNFDDGDDKFTSSVQAIEVYSDANKFTWGVNYHRLSGLVVDSSSVEEFKSLNIWGAGVGYKFDKNVYLHAEYAHANGLKDAAENHENEAYNIEVNYKGADMKDQGSWGAFLAYRHLGDAASLVPTYNSFMNDRKGWAIGAQYALLKNVLGYIEYGDGKELEVGGEDFRTIFGRIEAYF